MDEGAIALEITVGRQVSVELVDQAGTAEALSFQIVPDASANFARGLLGVSTPLAKALLGKFAGSVVDYPLGDIRQVRILSVAPGEPLALAELAAQRQEAAQKTAKELSRTNAAVFAASYSGKWGDYDPAGMEHWEEK